jgi:succinate dehydrogenase / fumarate reductase cytochrome b subunit
LKEERQDDKLDMGNFSFKRPLSPHLKIYKPQLTSVLSIMHRLTGIALSIGFLFFVYALGVLGDGKQAYENLRQWGQKGWVQTLLWGGLWALFYHTCQGIRHLLWDGGWGYELKRARQTGWAVVIISLLLTGFVAVYWFCLPVGGAP